jgi:Tol biopolymer transport system component
VTTTQGAGDFDVAQNGTLVYVSSADSSVTRTLVWVDRGGQEKAIPAPPRMYFGPQLSPDGARLAVAILDGENDIWIWEFARQGLRRFTTDPAVDNNPVWTPDGQQLLFASQRGGAANIYRQAIDGPESAEQLTHSPIPQQANTVTPDGAYAVISENWTGGALMLLALQEPYRVQPLFQTKFTARNSAISPDGRWLAYEANETPGHFEIFVRPLPLVNSGHWQVSTRGGTRPVWARNGTELFYLDPDGALMSVSIAKGSWNPGTPQKILASRYFAGIGGFTGRTYDVSPDGTRFLMIKAGGSEDPAAGPPNIVVVQHFDEELKHLMPKT